VSRPPLEVADLIRTAGTTFIERNRQWLRWKHIKALLAKNACCRSPKLCNAINLVPLLARPHAIHFKRILDFGEGQQITPVVL
jgi:hypothetical protein